MALDQDVRNRVVVKKWPYGFHRIDTKSALETLEFVQTCATKMT
ncbi:hypothetical protein QWZ16_18995 [Vibrio ostreicida]|uniref:Uncharacterized protein n=1 Tax=Vibrio ostreicida TaxID=526588 RepID=A0ABT8C062_9VIBR|nr:hypothetical protein [Vibrio ostreicida]MDN3611690.1 hypothetical protein [Vibrio ostreicida]